MSCIPHMLPHRLVNSLTELARRHGPALLRYSLALVFVWFGLLKVAGVSPITGLISATLPWIDPNLSVKCLGAIEIGIGLGLFTGHPWRPVLALLVAHLSGTFLTFVIAPTWMFRGYDPFLLTQAGEFVLKNVVLISAAIALMGTVERR